MNRPAQTQVMYLPCRLPDICLLPLIQTHEWTHTHTHTTLPLPLPFPPFLSQRQAMPIFPFFSTLWLADLRAARTHQRQTGGVAIHLLSACQPSQTSLGKQCLAREGCKHHQTEWHDPSNYLSFLGYGLAPYREVGCRPVIECRTHTISHTNSFVFHCHMGSQSFP